MAIIKIMFLMMLTMQISWAEDWLNKYEQGWFWGHDPKASKQDELPKVTPPKFTTPSKQVEQQRQEVTEALHKLMVEPTVENAVNLRRLQHKLMAMAQKSTDAFQKAAILDEQTDLMDIPTVNYARQDYYQAQSSNNINHIKQMQNQGYGLIYFYRSNCRFCHLFAPIVQNFATHHGFEVVAISIDGSKINLFANEQVDNGLSRLMKINKVPSLVAYNPQNNKYFPIARGAVAEEEIIENIAIMMAGGIDD